MPEGKAPKKWSPEEESQMLNEIDNNKTITQIAEIHDRSNNAIVMRLCEIGKKIIEKKGKNINDVQKVLKLVSVNEIENYIKKENEKKNKINKEEKVKEVKEETINSVKNELKELKTKYNKLEEKYSELKSMNDKFDELKNKVDKVFDYISTNNNETKGKKIKIKKNTD